MEMFGGGTPSRSSCREVLFCYHLSLKYVFFNPTIPSSKFILLDQYIVLFSIMSETCTIFSKGSGIASA